MRVFIPLLKLQIFVLLICGFNLFGESPREINLPVLLSHIECQDEIIYMPDSDSVLFVVKKPCIEKELEEVIITDEKLQKAKKSRSENIEIISSDYIEENLSGNLSKTLEKLPGIQSSNISPSLARPLIRGFGGYRIVISKNAMKLEDQSWNNHQGLAINQASIEEIEIIKGPASLYYGSDAIGGVINISTLSVPDSFGYNGVVGLKAESNNDLLGINAKMSYKNKLGFIKTDFSYQDFADFRVPADSFEYKPNHFAKLDKSLHNTAGKELSFNIQTGIIKKDLVSYFLFSYFDNKSGFFAYASGQELVDADRNLHSKSSRDILFPYTQLRDYDLQYVFNKYYNNSKLSSVIGYQQNNSDEYDNLKDISGNRQNDILNYKDSNLDLGYELRTISGRVNYAIGNSDSHSFVTGINGQYQCNDISGYSHLLPEYYRFQLGLYSEARYKIHEKFACQLGARIDYGSISIFESLNPDPEIGDSILNAHIDRRYPAFVYSVGLVYNPNKSLLAKLHIGKSYRMPAAYELASYGIHRHNLRFEKGMPDLNPEEAYQADIVFEYTLNNLQIAIYPFANYFSNYIYLSPTPDFSLGTFTGQVYEYSQNTALHYGAEAALLYKFSNNFHFLSSVEYVYPINLDTKKALPFSPPLSSVNELIYANPNKKIRIGFQANITSSQNRVAINESSTNGYMIFNLSAQNTFNIGKNEIITLIYIRNIADKNYMNHLSYYRRLNIPEPGRSLIFSLKIPLKFNTNHNV